MQVEEKMIPLLFITALLIGCSKQLQPSERNQISESKPIKNSGSLDAGIIFTDKPRQIAFSGRQIGITSATEVLSLSSSCDCVQFSVVEYVDQLGNSQAALLAKFPNNESHHHTRALPLLIESTAKLKEERSLVFTTKATLVDPGHDGEGQ